MTLLICRKTSKDEFWRHGLLQFGCQKTLVCATHPQEVALALPSKSLVAGGRLRHDPSAQTSPSLERTNASCIAGG